MTSAAIPQAGRRSARSHSDCIRVLGVHAGAGIGGAPVSMLDLLAALPADEFACTAAFTEPGPMVELARERGLRVRVVPAPAAFFYGAHVRLRLRMLSRLLLRFPASLRAAEKLLQAERPDLVYLNTSVLLPFAVAARRQGIPLVWHVREVLGPNPLLRRWHASFICGHARAVAATSGAVAACLPCGPHLHVIPNAVDLARFPLELLEQRAAIRAELGLSQRARVVAMLGSVQRVKGHWLVLEALRDVRRVLPDVQWLLAAGGVGPAYARGWKGRVKRALGLPLDNLDALQREARRAGLGDVLHAVGFRSDVPRLLAASDLVLFPSLQPEGFGRPLIEAMAMARPVIATDVGPTREIVGGEGAALLVPPARPERLAEAILQVLSDPDAADRMGSAGRRRAERNFPLSLQVGRMAALFRQVARS